MIKKIVSYLLDDFSYKIVALLVAISLWISFAGSYKQVRVMDVRLSYTLSNNMSFKTTPPSQVQIKLSGAKISMNNISNMKQSLVFDLQNAPEGINQLRVTKERLSLPLGVKLLEVNPEVIYLSLLKNKEEPKELKKDSKKKDKK